jgi:hypothetical protein
MQRYTASKQKVKTVAKKIKKNVGGFGNVTSDHLVLGI